MHSQTATTKAGESDTDERKAGRRPRPRKWSSVHGAAEPAEAEPGEPRQGVRAFDDVALADIPAQLAQLVLERGGIKDDDLVFCVRDGGTGFCTGGERDLVRRFAWSAKGRRFLELDEAEATMAAGYRTRRRR